MPSTVIPTDRRLRALHHRLTEIHLARPFWQYQGLHEQEACSFLLDSAMDPDGLGRFSFLGGDPFLVYKAKRAPRPDGPATARIEVTLRRDPAQGHLARPTVEVRRAEVFEDLRRVLADWRVDGEVYGDRTLPFLAGAVGYFGYETLHFIEEIPDLGADDLGMPDIYLGLYDVLLGHCHRSGRSFLSVLGRGSTDAEARERARRLHDGMLARIERFEAEDPAPERREPRPARAGDLEVTSRFDEERYCRLVETCQEHIAAGDVFEICLTHRLETPLPGRPWDLYRELRKVNPAPFASFLRWPEARIISSSPERYLRLGPDRVAESRPIKGTRPRGATRAEDDRRRADLLASVKDRAENVMSVDVARNDFGRVCRLGTIHVPELMSIEPYATVFQMVSTVRGELRHGLDALDLVRASFPGASMTGAPKIEAMKIISRLEPVSRGVYSGAIGYLDFAGPIDLAMVIRTILEKEGRCYLNVGGAIVSDSVPRAEYRETLDKARALLAALNNLQAGRQDRA